MLSYLFAFCGFLLGSMWVFAMKGYAYLGYLAWGISVLVLIYRFLNQHRYKNIRLVLTLCLVMGFFVYVLAEIQVIQDATTDSDRKAEYVIVLGSSVRGTNPSISLRDRLNRAYEYIRENPEVFVIVSGGQGNGEDISEAEAMRVWLEEKGVDAKRIIKEEQSTSTEENLKNSFALIEERGSNPKDGVGIISSEYHLHRAKEIARNLGANPYGIAAKTSILPVRINYFIREGLGVIYMWMKALIL